MKNRIVFGSMLVMLVAAFTASAQEYDDMYFNSKDRVKARANQPVTTPDRNNDKIDSDYDNFRRKHFDKDEQAQADVNPTDSYSARNVNPEYVSREDSEEASQDNQDYFVEGYSPVNETSANLNAANQYYNNNANNQWYNSGYYPYGSTFANSWYSPYYGYRPYSYGYDAWGYPYYGSSAYGYNYGNMWGSGWNYGLNFTYGNGYYCPSYYSYSPYYYGGGYGWGYPRTVIYVSDRGSRNYSKYASRNGSYASYNPNATLSDRERTGRTRDISNGRTSGNTNGRVSTVSNSRQTKQEDYYNPRRRAATQYYNNTRSTPTYGNSNYNSGNDSNRNSSFDFNRTRSTNTNNSSISNTRSSGTSVSPSRSSSSGSSGSSGGSRSSGGSSTGRTRGGN